MAMFVPRLWFTLVCCILPGPIVHAELRWRDPVQSFQRAPEDREVTATFAFRNTGTTQVTVRSIKTSCGCTTARLDKKSYAPGESGEIKARFVFGGLRGLQRKLITVKTDDGAEPAILDLRVMVQENVTVTPTLVYWRVGEPELPKSVRVTAHNNPVTIKGIVSENPEWHTELETVKAGEDFIVRIKPPGTNAKSGTKMRIVTDFPVEEPRSYVVHGRVK